MDGRGRGVLSHCAGALGWLGGGNRIILSGGGRPMGGVGLVSLSLSLDGAQEP